MSGVFRFTFYIEEEDREVVRDIPLNCPEDRLYEILDEIHDPFTSDLEERFGVHDVSGHTEKDGSFDGGFCTYEVPEGKIDELMGIWKQKLTECGIVDQGAI